MESAKPLVRARWGLGSCGPRIAGLSAPTTTVAYMDATSRASWLDLSSAAVATLTQAFNQRAATWREPTPTEVAGLLEVATGSPDTGARCWAAAALPFEHWRTAVDVLLTRFGGPVDARRFIFRLPPSGQDPHRYADRVFAHLWLLAATCPDWTGVPVLAPARWPEHTLPTDMGEDISAAEVWWSGVPAGMARHVGDAVHDATRALANMINDALANAYVVANDHWQHTGASLVRDLVWRCTDPEVLTILFDTPRHASVQASGHPWRRACLNRPELPEALRLRALTDAGTSPGRPSREHRYIGVETSAVAVAKDARAAATMADPGQVAALVLADPERWWATLTRAGIDGNRPRGLTSLPHTEAVHRALAVQVQDAGRRVATGDGAADQMWLDGCCLSTRTGLVERLSWLAEKAEGPGFDDVLAALLAFPDVRVRRKAAKHSQISGEVAANLMTDGDRWVRVNAARHFERALASA